MIWHSSLNWSDTKQFFNLLSPRTSSQQFDGEKFMELEISSVEIQTNHDFLFSWSASASGMRRKKSKLLKTFREADEANYEKNYFVIKNSFPPSESISTYHNLCVSWLLTLNNLIFVMQKIKLLNFNSYQNNISFSIFDTEPSEHFGGKSLPCHATLM